MPGRRISARPHPYAGPPPIARRVRGPDQVGDAGTRERRPRPPLHGFDGGRRRPVPRRAPVSFRAIGSLLRPRRPHRPVEEVDDATFSVRPAPDAVPADVVRPIDAGPVADARTSTEGAGHVEAVVRLRAPARAPAGSRGGLRRSRWADTTRAPLLRAASDARGRAP
ncbi:hypothetical protein OIE71_14715 [Streptomyces sp. NBC_01725]|uniref:hypothetical protein n=1 Tax=Streptomyces sp. NBC_01725 TaxID=2975923 RepID=UPI002E284AE1|nr:hypothetical protein [Streptomyces sp. NBC_01725]